jgi:hypothetical protein
MSRWQLLLASLLIPALGWVGCDLFMSQLSKGPALDSDTDTDDLDASPDGGDDYCPGYTGFDPCCTPDDPCTFANDSICDCDGTCPWDTADCGSDTDADSDTDVDTDVDTDADGGADGGIWCVGYEGDDPCCAIDDPCAWAGDSVCDCDATCDWDWEDC